MRTPISIRIQRGYTLIELSIALVIALFLIGGLLSVTQDNRRALNNQSALAQLQDNERTAMTLLTDVIQAAGYYAKPTTNTAASLFPVSGLFATAGQGMVGTGAWGGADEIWSRYATIGQDGILVCNGQSNTTDPTVVLVPQTYTNRFFISANTLVCRLNGVTYPLVNNVSQMQIRYGVKRNAAVSGNNADTYLDATQMVAADWLNVMSVYVQLTFIYTPLNLPAQNVTFSRTIPVLSAGGITI